MPTRPNSHIPTLRAVACPARLTVPLAGGPSSAAPDPKAIGSVVKRGDTLVESKGESGHVPLAPADGKIVGFVTVDALTGAPTPAAILETEPASPTPTPEGAPASASNEPGLDYASAALPDVAPSDLPAWIDRLRDAGVWAHRRTSPDLLGQLLAILRRPCDTVVCNALDTDADVPLNAVTAAAFPDELLAGLRLLGQLSGAARVLVAADVSNGFGPLAARCKKARVRVVPVRNVYPQSDPTLLLYTLLRRRLRPGRMPTSQGVLLLDAVAAVAVGRLVRNRHAMLETPVAVFDAPRRQAHHLLVPVGMSIGQLLAALSGSTGAAAVRVSDALRAVTASPEAVLAGGELLVHVGYAAASVNPDPCIRCGWCVQACPTRVHPAGLLEAAQSHDAAKAERFGVDGCIECGICSYVCPSRLPLLGAIRDLRTALTGRPG